jgi:hypothetical protein
MCRSYIDVVWFAGQLGAGALLLLLSQFVQNNTTPSWTFIILRLVSVIGRYQVDVLQNHKGM